MMEFRKISLNDKKKYDKYVVLENSKSADFSFANVFMWDDKYNQELLYINDMAVIKIGDEYRCPIGPNMINDTIRALKTDSPLIIKGVTDSRLDELKNIGLDYDLIYDRNFSDYIYDIDSLIRLNGKKLHAKRNHINKFFQTYTDYKFMELSNDMFDDCVKVLEMWIDSDDKNIIDERIAIIKSFKYWDEFDFLGGILYIGEKPCGFCMGEVISNDTFCIHFEKAIVDNAYAYINNEFVKLIKYRYPFIKYVNREEDMGLLNLRKSKLSYQPSLVNKYNAIFIDKWIKDECMKLYLASFNDDINYVDVLFKEYSYALKYIIKDNHVISMLFAIDMIYNGNEVKYIYGACTKMEYRNKGYMSKLIGSIKNYPLLLKPAHKDLYSFYEKLGFSKICGVSVLTDNKIDYEYDVSVINDSEYIDLRNKLVDNGHILFDERYIRVALSYLKSASDKKSYVALYEVIDDRIDIKEFIGDIKAMGSIAKINKKEKYSYKVIDSLGDNYLMGYNIDATLMLTLD